MIDEAAADTPWGGSGVWGRHSLLAMFHNETEGGEKVFQLMARLAEKPKENRDLLELIYAAITLGFEGRYRVIDNGRAQLDAVRDRLAQILRKERGDHSHALAEHWQGQPGERAALMGRIADALAQVVGNVLVTGHTDNQPITRSARYPSNWHLSDERARNVRDLLIAHKVNPDRIRAEGRADAEPVVPNDTAS